MRKVLIAAFAAMVIAGPVAQEASWIRPAKPSVEQVKEFIVAQRQSCKAASSCQEAVEMWCGGYSRADADGMASRVRTFAGPRSQVDSDQAADWLLISAVPASAGVLACGF